MHPLFERLVAEVRTDIGQMVEEGHDLDALRAELAAAEATGSLDAVAALQADLWRRPSPPEFGYDEPNDWETLRAGFPDPHSHAPLAGGQDVLADRLLAAWRGRCAGCQLGKPLEGLWPDDARRLLTAIGSWPLDDYPNTVAEARLAELMAEDEIFRRVDPAGVCGRGCRP